MLERADDVGGTWQANTYPGCQCDVPSHLYSFSFEPNPSWTRTYSRQPEIWAYLRRCTERYGLAPHLRLGHELTGATWDEAQQRWHVETTRRRLLGAAPHRRDGAAEPSRRAARSAACERFEGKLFHSAEWDHDHDLTGERVAVIGTGASAIQFVPRIQSRSVRCTSSSARRRGSCRTPTGRPRASSASSTGAMPLAQRLVRTVVYWTRESYRRRLREEPRMARAGRADRAAAPAPPGPRPRAAAQARAGLPPRLQARAALQRVVSGADAAERRARHRRDLARRRARGSCSPTAARARSTRSSSARASTSPTRRRRSSCAAAAA